MKDRIRYNCSLNPALALIPVLVFLFSAIYLNYTISFFFGLITSIIYLFVDYRLKQSISHPILLLSIFISFLISFFYSFFDFAYTSIVFEVTLLLQLLILLVNKSGTLRVLYKAEINSFKSNKDIVFEFFRFIRRIELSLSIYLILFLSVTILKMTYVLNIPKSEEYLTILKYLMYLYLFIYEYLRIYIISNKIESEEWLPIIDNNMNVIGRIAKRLSLESKNQCLHPRVRILAFYQGRLLLRPIECDNPILANKFDTPYCKDIIYGEQIIETVNSIASKFSLNKEKINFVTRYIHESASIRRVVFLFIIHLKDEKSISKKIQSKSKFWTESELLNNLNKNILSEFIESEYDFLSSIIYPSIKIMNDDRFDNHTWSNSVGEDLSSHKPSL